MTETATFGMGCFWGPQKHFANVAGVMKTTVGFMGGEIQEPTYEAVCAGETGHTEVVQLEFDPAELSYETLLDHFFSEHDAAREKRGQYRSTIFYHSPEQEQTAKKRLAAEPEAVTTLRPATTFYPAEEYHQHYLAKSEA